MFLKQYEVKDYLIIELGVYAIPLGLLILMLSFYFLYISISTKPKKEHFTICPKCKESFDYNNLDNGKCPTCKDGNNSIDTVDIDKYYEDNPYKESSR
jgi:hypothetical protein